MLGIFCNCTIHNLFETNNSRRQLKNALRILSFTLPLHNLKDLQTNLPFQEISSMEVTSNHHV